MQRSEITARLTDILVMAMGDDAAEAINSCTENTTLADDLGLNSVGILYVVIGIEEAFNISFDNACFSDFKTVGDVIDFIAKKTE